MPNILLPNTTVWHNLNTLSSIGRENSLLIHNQGTKAIYVSLSPTTPIGTTSEFPIKAGETRVTHAHSDQYVWVKGGSGRIVVQSYRDSVLPVSAVELPHYLYTSDNEHYRRLRVDNSQTGFFLGTEGRTFRELNIANGTTLVIKAVTTVDIILHSLSVVVDSGSLKVTTLIGGTEGGSFSETLPSLPKNNMTGRPTPTYALTSVLSAGGTHTGGTPLDIVRVVATNATAQQSSVGGQVASERGIAAGTYYFKLENVGTGAVTGVFSGWWEERAINHFS